MTSEKIPDRFLAFSFGLGDVLCELDADHIIRHVEGAVSLMGASPRPFQGLPFSELLNREDQAKLQLALSQADPIVPRIGPLSVSLGTNPARRRRFLLFASGLFGDGRLFVGLIQEHRLPSCITRPNSVGAKEKICTDAFMDRVDNFFEDYPTEAESMRMTLVDVDPGDASRSNMDALAKQLQLYAAGGDMIGQLSETRLALLHSEDHESDTFVQQASEAASISASTLTLDEPDSNRIGAELMLHSMREVLHKAETESLEQLSSTYNAALSNNMEEARKFRQALNNRCFSMVFQPIVNLKTKQVHHFEALARFEGLGGSDGPFKTIQFAEEVGLIADLDFAVLAMIEQQISNRGRSRRHANVAINLSGKSLSSDAFCQRLMAYLQEHGNLQRHISFEITESARIENLARLNSIVQVIRHMGYRVYLDDFGAGASGFQYLRTLKVDGVKIDGPYIRDAIEDGEARSFLKAMTGLCRDLGIDTVGEWVETREQAELLTQIGVTYGQGFYFGAPQPYGASMAKEEGDDEGHDDQLMVKMAAAD